MKASECARIGIYRYSRFQRTYAIRYFDGPLRRCNLQPLRFCLDARAGCASGSSTTKGHHLFDASKGDLPRRYQHGVSKCQRVLSWGNKRDHISPTGEANIFFGDTR